MARVLVTDAGLGSAVSVIRSLGRRGHTVVAASSDRLAPGRRSRYATAALRYADPDVEPDRMLDQLADAVVVHGIDVLFPITDDVILPLSAARERFDALCTVALPSAAALDAAADKLQTIELARRLDVPVPRTVLVEAGADAGDVPELGWPIVVKPRRSYLYQEGARPSRHRVTYARDASELAEVFHGLTHDVLLQEYRSGVGRAVSVLADEGRPLAAFQHRRLREVPVGGGASSLRESEPVDPALLGMATRLVDGAALTGLAMVEFREGADGPALMEINARVWGSLPLAVHSGMDFPARYVDLLLGASSPGHGEVDTSYEVGVRSRALDLERAWVAEVLGRRRPTISARPGRRAAVPVMLSLVVPDGHDDHFDRRDPLPSVVELVRVTANAVRGLRRR